MKPSADIVHTARIAFQNGKTKSMRFREKQLKSLLLMYEDNRSQMETCLNKDLRRSQMESIVLEIDRLINDLKTIISEFKSWAATETPKSNSLLGLISKLKIYKEPYGVVLIIGAWNYPLALCLMPLAGAIAAGNTAIIKPSHISSATSELIAELIPRYLDSECYHVILGGVSETVAILKEKFDFILFNGSISVGKVIQEAAGKFLTPTLLNLSGKNPVYLDKTADLLVATRRILWGKLINAGQTYAAPDYVLCTKEIRDKFINLAKLVINEFYGKEPKLSQDYCRIISEGHFWRLKCLLNKSKIAVGGETIAKNRYIEPTIIIEVQSNDSILQEEILGPILPIIVIKNLGEAVKFINSKEKPLALYIFSTNKSDTDLIISNTSSGGICINETALHQFVDNYPGLNGVGGFHGQNTFDTFTHRKSILLMNYNGIWETLFSARYPPYTKAKMALMKALLKRRRLFKLKAYFPHFGIFSLGMFTALLGSYFCRQFRKLTL